MCHFPYSLSYPQTVFFGFEASLHLPAILDQYAGPTNLGSQGFRKRNEGNSQFQYFESLAKKLCAGSLYIPYAPWCWNIIPTFARTKSPSFVGKYTSTMEHMGYVCWQRYGFPIDFRYPYLMVHLIVQWSWRLPSRLPVWGSNFLIFPWSSMQFPCFFFLIFLIIGIDRKERNR